MATIHLDGNVPDDQSSSFRRFSHIKRIKAPEFHHRYELNEVVNVSKQPRQLAASS